MVYLSKLYISNKAIPAPNQGENNQTPGQAVDDWKAFSGGTSTGGILEVTDPNFPTIPIAKGGTGSSSAGTARTALGITAVLVRGFLASLSGTNRSKCYSDQGSNGTNQLGNYNSSRSYVLSR